MSKFLLILFILVTSAESWSKTQLLTIKSYQELGSSINHFISQAPSHSTLVIFDIDDTLLHVQDCLSQLDTMKDGLNGWIALVSRCPVIPTEPQVSEMVAQIQRFGADTMALTARGSAMIDKTEEHLKFININFYGMPFTKTSDFVEQLTPSKKLYFIGGVAWTSGIAKGNVLKYLQTHRFRNPYTQIVFFDDNIDNIKSVRNAFENDQRVNALIVHYTKFNKTK